jgi:putative RecB family exonuclease
MSAVVATPATGEGSIVGKDRNYISFSSIRAYQACPLKYFFKYVAGLPEESVAATLIFGTAIHRAIEHHYCELLAGNASPTVDALIEEYRAGWEDREGIQVRFGKEETREDLDTTAKRMLEAFVASSLAKPTGRILAVEETLRGLVIPGLPDLLGRVDLIIETDAELVIADWKTSRSRWSAEQVEDAAEQLLLYAELAQDFAPGKRVRLEFVVLTKTKEVAVDQHLSAVDPLRVKRTKQVVERVWRAIEAGHFYPAPSPMNCAGCPYRQPCRAWCG